MVATTAGTIRLLYRAIVNGINLMYNELCYCIQTQVKRHIHAHHYNEKR